MKIRVIMTACVFMVAGRARGFKEIYKPRNPRQEKYVDVLKKSSFPLVISEGPAGTGKTALACQTALELLHKQTIKRIVLTRPVVSADEGIGFLKGSMHQKMNPWITPMVDVFLEFYSTEKIKHLFDSRVIEIAPVSFLRGRTFKSSFIIADEMQNATPVQTKLLLTRLGQNSRMILTGDLGQSDLDGANGLEDLIFRLETRLGYDMFGKGIALVRFQAEHIERHPLLLTLSDLYGDL